MQHAVDSHDFAAPWKYARLLSAKHIGPHGRVYNAFPSGVPSLKEWSDYLAKPGCEGGLGAKQLWHGDRDDMTRLIQACAPLRAPSWRTDPTESEFQPIHQQATLDYVEVVDSPTRGKSTR
eukprot:1976255-Heterocapsa_arctica.AAC.1